MWTSFKDAALNREDNKKITPQDLIYFVRQIFNKEFGNLAPEFEITEKKENIILKITTANPLIKQEILNRQEIIQKYIKQKTDIILQLEIQ